MGDRIDVDRFISEMPQKYLDRITAAYVRANQVAPIVVGLGGLASLVCLGLTILYPAALAGSILVLALYVVYSTGTFISKYRSPSLRWAWLAAAAATGVAVAAIAAVGEANISGLVASLLAILILAVWSIPAYFAVRSVAYLRSFLVIMEEATAERKRELLEQERQRELEYLAWSQRKPKEPPPPLPPAAAKLPLPKSK